MGPLTPKQQQLHAEAKQCLERGDFGGAAERCRQVLRKSPGHPEVLYDLAGAQMRLGRAAEAERTLRTVLRHAPDSAATHVRLALCLRELGRFEDAHRAADAALATRRTPDALVAKAELLHLEGDDQAGFDLLRPHAQDPSAAAGILFEFARLAARLDRADEARRALDRLLERPGLAGPIAADARFELASQLEAAGEHARAWEVCAEANARQPSRFDPEAHVAMIDRVIDAWERSAVAALPRARVETELPVFIVGMPRSGTTLVEQILASHPQVHGGGELSKIFPLVARLQAHDTSVPAHIDDLSVLTQAAVDRAAREYLRAIRDLDRAAARITDKQPFNFLYLGFIRLLYPQARVVHCVRDARDTAVSCWFQSFGGTVWFATDLQHIATFYRGYRRLMAHWATVLDGPQLELSYEALVHGQEAESRRLVEFLGLPWDEACLRFFETRRVVRTESIDEVRRPMYASSVGRWKHYERQLAPIVDQLVDQP